MAKKQAPPYSLRMPLELRESIEKRADENDRSLNAELVYLLELALNAPPQTELTPQITERLNTMEAKYLALIKLVEDLKKGLHEMK